jgi:hypothetical protein
VLSTYAHLARTAYEFDRPLFAELLEKLNDLEPGYVPQGPAHLRWASRLLGYERAEWLALQYRGWKSLWNCRAKRARRPGRRR